MFRENEGNPSRRYVEEIFDILHDAGQHDEDITSLRTLREAREAFTYEGPLFSGNELADLMGLEREESGEVPVIPFMNACMRVEEFEGIQRLPREERIKAMSTAFHALSTLYGGS